MGLFNGRLILNAMLRHFMFPARVRSCVGPNDYKLRADGFNYAMLGAPRTPRRTSENPSKTSELDLQWPHSAGFQSGEAWPNLTWRWWGDHPAVPPVSLRFRPKPSLVVLLRFFSQLIITQRRDKHPKPFDGQVQLLDWFCIGVGPKASLGYPIELQGRKSSILGI